MKKNILWGWPIFGWYSIFICVLWKFYIGCPVYSPSTHHLTTLVYSMVSDSPTAWRRWLTGHNLRCNPSRVRLWLQVFWPEPCRTIRRRESSSSSGSGWFRIRIGGSIRVPIRPGESREQGSFFRSAILKWISFSKLKSFINFLTKKQNTIWLIKCQCDIEQNFMMNAIDFKMGIKSAILF